MTKAIVKTEPIQQPDEAVSMQSALIQIVQRQDIDPDRLEKFLDLQIKMENRQAERAFNEALALFQGECPIIRRTKKTDFTSKSGNQTKYDYSPLDEIVHVVKPILNKHGFSYSFNVKENEKSSTLITTIRHKDGHSVPSELEFESLHDDGRMNNSQRRKSALTYVKRAGLENALGIVTAGEDDDARRAVDAPVTEEQLAEITEMIKQTKSDEKKFLEFLQVSKLADLSEYEGKKAIMALKQKRSGGK